MKEMKENTMELQTQEAVQQDNWVIKDEDVVQAEEIRKKYRSARENLDERIKENDRYWKLQHSNLEVEQKKEVNGKQIKYKANKRTSAWLFNSIINKHADAMDNFPEPNILPREESDRETASILSKVVVTVLEQCNFEETYDKAWTHKLKSGTGAYGVFWNNEKYDGLGDIDICELNILNIDFEPGITDIQKSKNLFIVDMVDIDDIKQQYGIEVKGTGKDSYVPSFSKDDYMDYSNYTAVVDWYYKKRVRYEDEYNRPKIKTVLHYVKYCDGKVLYASENDEEYAEKGWYEHGRYPVEFDIQFSEEDYPTGIGYIDIMKNPQKYIDKLSTYMLENAAWGSKPRYFAKENVGVNLEDFLDLDKTIVETNGNVDEEHLRVIETPRLDGNYMSFVQYMVEELKETSGNRDFSQGSTSSGVTSGSAIAALMEAGSKLSRDAIKSAYRTYNRIVYQVIELMRQFYDDRRIFRITKPNGDIEFEEFSNKTIKEQEVTVDGTVIGTRKPIFDVQCRAQKSSPFSKLSQNELAKELLNLGFFNPQMADQSLACIEMMDFEGKDMVIQRISQNGTMFQQMIQMQQQMAQMNQTIQELTGQVMGEAPEVDSQVEQPQDYEKQMGEINELGAEISEESPMMEKMRDGVRQQTGV